MRICPLNRSIFTIIQTKGAMRWALQRRCITSKGDHSDPDVRSKLPLNAYDAYNTKLDR